MAPYEQERVGKVKDRITDALEKTLSVDYVRSDSTSKYRYSGIQINPWFLLRLEESNVFAGPQVDINYDKISDETDLSSFGRWNVYSYGFER